MNLKKIFENYFFKKRYIYITDTSNKNKLKIITENKKLNVKFIKLCEKKTYSVLLDVYNNKEKVEKYMNRDENIWKLIILYSENKPAGAFWILQPNKDVIYDSFLIKRSQLLFCSVYVNPKYRGKSFYNYMHKFAFNYWESNASMKEVITIVEKSNIASNISNRKYGLEVLGINYLFKFFGKNIISVYKKNDKNNKIILFLNSMNNKKKVIK